jgi:hypothetical protein
MNMPDRFSRNGARAVALTGVALFAVILGLLAVQMASGKDPALGARKPAKSANRVAAAPQPVQPPQPSYTEPSYTEPGYDDGYGGYTDDGSQDAYVAPQQDTQQQDVQPQQSQQQSQAPLQSSTS